MRERDIFTELAKHQLKGIMFHYDMINYMCFLGFPVLSEIHEKQFEEESEALVDIARHYIELYNHLPEVNSVQAESIIPKAWHGYNRHEISADGRKKALETALKEWAEWETKSCELYSECYQKLIDGGHAESAEFLSDIISDTCHEKKFVNGLIAELKAVDYDMPSSAVILRDASEKHNKKDKPE